MERLSERMYTVCDLCESSCACGLEPRMHIHIGNKIVLMCELDVLACDGNKGKKSEEKGGESIEGA